MKLEPGDLLITRLPVNLLNEPTWQGYHTHVKIDQIMLYVGTNDDVDKDDVDKSINQFIIVLHDQRMLYVPRPLLGDSHYISRI